VNDPLTGLVKKLDQRLASAAKGPRTRGAYVIFDSNADGLDKKLRGIAEKEALKHVTLGIGAPPADYQVAKGAEVTVVIYNPDRRGRQKVTANFALRKGELDDAKADAITKALSEVLPK
jgi:hypothetical protein